MHKSRQILHSGLEQLGLSATEAQLDALLDFVSLIEKWNKAYNLTAIRKHDEMLRLHILDSLAILPYLSGKKILDVGTGAGLPGIPLAIFRPDISFALLDSNSKKTRFVQQAVLELKLKNVEVIHSRVEKLARDAEYDAILSRAFASFDDIMNLTEYLLQPEGVLLAMKAQVSDSELNAIKRPFTIHPITVPGVDAERCVVQIHKK
ncbi:MAG: 16S rRNA (guanine(527)-N(7))-methyltransferase RsmG [Methyloprofundus sp.]|nr:16S rRNA (guanine(527)-N(7))-methyltransferase RsmG [Methyloprofundus sp.]